MTDTNTSLKSPAATASAAAAKPNPSAPSAPAKPQTPPPVAPAKQPEEVLSFDKDKYPGVAIVRMRLLQAGTIQYDPSNNELILDTADEKGKLLPLTPFFSQRIGRTLELVI